MFSKESHLQLDSETPQSPRATAIQFFLFFLVTFFGCANTILTSISRNEANKYDYETVSVPMCTELAKLAISLVFLMKDSTDRVSTAFAAILDVLDKLNGSLSWQYATIAVLYALQNNLLFHTLRYLDPGTFQILANIRIPLVALMLFFILRKLYSKQQIVGIAMLTFGAMLYSAGKSNSHTDSRETLELTTGHSQLVGYALVLLMTLFASVAGVFNEYCLKEGLHHQSVDLQNTQLYLFGFLINFAALMVKQPMLFSIFDGYNATTTCIIINSAFFGVSIGYITKYCDNNVRSFAGVSSMLLATVYSHFFMSVPLPTGYPASLSLVTLGILMYAKAFTIS